MGFLTPLIVFASLECRMWLNLSSCKWRLYRCTVYPDPYDLPGGCICTLFSWQTVWGHFISGFERRAMTKCSRYLGIRLYDDPPRRSHFHLASSEGTICKAISRQSLYRSARQHICLMHRFPTHVRWGSMISLCMYPTCRLTELISTEVSLLIVVNSSFCSTEGSAVRSTRYADNCSFFPKDSSFAVSWMFILLREVHVLKFNGVVLTIRIYALYGFSKRLLTWMIIVGFALAVGACVCIHVDVWTGRLLITF